LLFDYLAARHGEPVPLLGERPAPEGRFPAWRWREMLELAAARLGDPALGLRVGAGITPAHLGPLGYVMVASPSAGAALERYLRYQRLAHDVSPVHARVEGEALVLEWSAQSREVGILVNQCGLAAVVQFARAVAGPARPLSASFVEAAPQNSAPYHELLGC